MIVSLLSFFCVFYLGIMPTDVFIFQFFFLDYAYYETLGTQQPSLQCQISCCLVTHPSDVPTPVYDWNEVAVSGANICIFLWENIGKILFFFNFLCFFFSSNLGLRSSLMSPWVALCKMNPLVSTQSYHHRGTAKVSGLNILREQLYELFFCNH